VVLQESLKRQKCAACRVYSVSGAGSCITRDYMLRKLLELGHRLQVEGLYDESRWVSTSHMQSNTAFDGCRSRRHECVYANQTLGSERIAMQQIPRSRGALLPRYEAVGRYVRIRGEPKAVRSGSSSVRVHSQGRGAVVKILAFSRGIAA